MSNPHISFTWRSHYESHVSKGISDIKQKCTQLLTPFSGTVFHTLFMVCYVLYWVSAPETTFWMVEILHFQSKSSLYLDKKHASCSSALRKDRVWHTRHLLSTYPISPTPWTWPWRPLGPGANLQSDYHLRMSFNYRVMAWTKWGAVYTLNSQEHNFRPPLILLLGVCSK